MVTPGEKAGAGPGIGTARIRIAYVCGKEFDVASGGFLAEIGDQRRHHVQRSLVSRDLRLLDGRR